MRFASKEEKCINKKNSKFHMFRKIGFTNYRSALAQIVIVLSVLYLTSLHSFLLFHSVVEVTGIVISLVIFIIAWNVRKFLDTSFFQIVGTGLLFASGFSLFHLLSYKGIEIFPGIGSNLATQLWLASRFLVGITFLIAPLFARRKTVDFSIVGVFLFFSSILALSIFYWGDFPIAYSETEGLTFFKRGSEYIISLMLVGSIGAIYLNRNSLNKKLYKLLLLSIVLSIFSEIAFTEYVSVYGQMNLIGHMLMIVSIYIIYLAIIENALRAPAQTLFRNLKNSALAVRKNEEKLQKINDLLEIKAKERTAELSRANEELVRSNKLLNVHNEILELIGKATSRKEFLGKLVDIIREKSRCECVGIRIISKGGRIPYDSYVGFDLDFWKLENDLSVNRDQCACVRVFTGNIEPQDLPAMSLCGSFYSNDTNQFIASLSEEEKRRYRGNCAKCGYKSIAVIPISYNQKRLGIIHLASKSPDKIPLETVNFFESLSNLIGEAIKKFDARDKVRKLKKEREVAEKRLVESYKHLGLINRQISILLDLERRSQEGKNKKSQEIIKYILGSAITLSGADYAFVYKFNGGNFSLLAARGIKRKPDEEMRLISKDSLSFLDRIVKNKESFEGFTKKERIGCLNVDNKVKCFLTLPLVRKRSSELKGVIFLGFSSFKQLGNQEIEFFDVFASHAFSALMSAKVLK